MARRGKQTEHSLDDDFDWSATLEGKVTDEAQIPEVFFSPTVGPLTSLSSPTINTTTEREQKNGDKVTTNLQQSGSKPTTKVTTNLQQSGSKPTTNLSGANDELKETYNKLPTQLTTQPTTNLQQSGSKPTTNTVFLTLVGLQRKIIVFLYELCRCQGARVTGSVSISNIAVTCETTVRAAQETIRRLEQKRFIRRVEYKNGRGGWTTYELPEDVYKELFQLETYNKLTTKLQQTPNKLPTQLTTQPTTSLSSSSSSIDINNFKTTTTGEAELFENGPIQLSPEWVNLDLTPLTGIGFTQNHLTQIIKQGKLQPSEVQDSIHFFAFDLARNGKGRTLNGSPLNFFMGILRKGTPYAPPENYESPADEARRKTREFKERKERERLADEQRIMDLEFSEWRRGLTADEVMNLVPEFARRIGPLQDSTLKTHFETQVWPTRELNQDSNSESERQQIRAVITEALGEVRK